MSELFSLADRTALVTGSSRGIGAAVAVELLRVGARVLLCARSVDELAATAEELAPLGDVRALPADLSSVDGVRALAGALDGPLHLLVNNAGTTRDGELADYPEDDWTRHSTSTSGRRTT